MDQLIFYAFWAAALGPFIANPIAWMFALIVEYDQHRRERLALAGVAATAVVFGFAPAVRLGEGGALWLDPVLFYTCLTLFFSAGAAYWIFEARNFIRALQQPRQALWDRR